MTSFNPITIILVIIFISPLLIGMFEPFSKERIRYSLYSLLDNVEFIFALMLSIYLTRQVFFENHTGVYKQIYDLIPGAFKTLIYGRDILAYILVVPVVLLLILAVFRFLTSAFFRLIIEPLSDGIYSIAETMGSTMRKFASIIWNIPKAIFIVIILAFLINFYSYYFSTPSLSKWLNESSAYSLLYNKVLYPVLNSNIAKQVPVLINDSFRRNPDDVAVSEQAEGNTNLARKLAEQLKKANINVIEYFNGVTLDEAIKSSPEIDAAAKEIVGSEKNDRKKANLIYKWVSSNVRYDYDKAKEISINPRGISSGSAVAFETRKGICFDYSCLYISMCKAVGLKVRLVTGLGYSGVSWGDHAWNQVFSSQENRWINVDATFGTAGNYFDKPDFNVDHKYDEVQGEW